MNIVWTESDKVFIRLHPEMTDKELSQYFQTIHKRPVSISAIKKFRQRMGAKKKVGRKSRKENNKIFIEENSKIFPKNI